MLPRRQVVCTTGFSRGWPCKINELGELNGSIFEVLNRMIASFFDTAKTQEFADWIVAELKRAAPPDLASRKIKKKHVARARTLDENIARRIVEFTRATPLNIYKKAQLAARLREGLRSHGYPEEFVKSFSIEVIELMQTAKKPD